MRGMYRHLRIVQYLHACPTHATLSTTQTLFSTKILARRSRCTTN